MGPIYYLLDLRNDPHVIAAYKAWHEPGAVPEPVTRSLREAGIEALEIYLVGNRLMMVLTPGERFDAAKKAAADEADPDVQAWETLMWSFQQALPFAAPGEKWTRMDQIYSLGEQP